MHGGLAFDVPLDRVHPPLVGVGGGRVGRKGAPTPRATCVCCASPATAGKATGSSPLPRGVELSDTPFAGPCVRCPRGDLRCMCSRQRAELRSAVPVRRVDVPLFDETMPPARCDALV